MADQEDTEAVSMSHNKANLRKDKVKLASAASDRDMKRNMGFDYE